VTPEVRRSFVRVAGAVVHYAEAGGGEPVLLLHQTPRSWDEYREVLPLLGRSHRGIAMDTVGFGDSTRARGRPAAIETFADSAAQLLAALGIERAAVVGHHTGGVIALELAASRPELVSRLVCSSTAFVDAEGRARRAARPVIDEVEPRDDGSHLVELWRGRARFYPPGRPDLLTRFAVDALRAEEPPDAGHRAVWQYRMEERIGLVRAPALLIGATDDPFAYPHLRQLAAALPGAKVVELEGGMVPLPDQLPEQFAAAVADFLSAR
jgi:pimeloyl-ACP methyl ester carboxylesterase